MDVQTLQSEADEALKNLREMKEKFIPKIMKLLAEYKTFLKTLKESSVSSKNKKFLEDDTKRKIRNLEHISTFSS